MERKPNGGDAAALAVMSGIYTGIMIGIAYWIGKQAASPEGDSADKPPEGEPERPSAESPGGEE